MKQVQPISSVLAGKVIERRTDSRVRHSFQDVALRIIRELEIPKARRSAYFAIVKRSPPALISRAFSFAKDYPNHNMRDKIFFWKLYKIKKECQQTGA